MFCNDHRGFTKIRSKMTWPDRACFAEVPASPEKAKTKEAAARENKYHGVVAASRYMMYQYRLSLVYQRMPLHIITRSSAENLSWSNAQNGRNSLKYSLKSSIIKFFTVLRHQIISDFKAQKVQSFYEKFETPYNTTKKLKEAFGNKKKLFSN